MTCAECQRYLDAFLDGELDARASADVQDHVAGCAACGRIHALGRGLSGALQAHVTRAAVPAALEKRLGRAVRGASRRSRRWIPIAAIGAPAIAGAVALVLVALPRQHAARPAAEEVVSAHLRSLQADHLLDVESSDRHVVKPWFQGHIDFTLTPTDLAQHGFTLAGGRVDHVAGHPVAALVYRKQAHVMNVLCWEAGVAPAVHDGSHRGFSIAAFRRGDVACAVVADSEQAGVRKLRDLLAAAPP